MRLLKINHNSMSIEDIFNRIDDYYKSEEYQAENNKFVKKLTEELRNEVLLNTIKN